MHTNRRIASILFPLSFGMMVYIYMHDYTLELFKQNDDMRVLINQMRVEMETMRFCMPPKSGKSIISYVNNKPFCEIHINK